MSNKDGLQIFFGMLPPLLPQLDKYRDRGKCVKIFKNENVRSTVLFPESRHYLLYVHEGKVKVCTKRVDGTILNSFFCGPDTVIGKTKDSPYMSLCDCPELIACENSVIYYFDYDVLYELIVCDKKLLADFLDLNFAYYTLFSQRMAMTSNLDAEQRILGWLNRLCKGAETKPNGSLFIPCSMTQQEIADYLFIHLTTCNKILAKLKKENLVLKARKGITVTDYEKLKNSLLLLIDV